MKKTCRKSSAAEQIVVIHPHYKWILDVQPTLTQFSDIQILVDKIICLEKIVRFATIPVFVCVCMCVCTCAYLCVCWGTWYGEGTLVHSHNHNLGVISAKDKQIKATLPVRGHFIKPRYPRSGHKQTKSQ